MNVAVITRKKTRLGGAEICNLRYSYRPRRQSVYRPHQPHDRRLNIYVPSARFFWSIAIDMNVDRYACGWNGNQYMDLALQRHNCS